MSGYTPPVVAVLGGGQLGRMLGLAGVPLGLDFRFLDPSPQAPAQAVGALTVGALDDERALLETVEGAQVVTYEWEGVPAHAARMLEATGARVDPSTSVLEVSQDRLAEKTTFQELGIPVFQFFPVDDLEGLRAAVEAVGLPAVLKTRRGGYDGKGQAVLREPPEVEPRFAELSAGGPLILEAFVEFDRELSVLAVRDRRGEVRVWPLIENHHVDGILRVSRAPAPDVTPGLQPAAAGYARSLLEHFDYVGVITLELFQVGDQLAANEMAPRVHNSGHWTIEGAVTSQFENHLRALLGWPLGSTEAVGVSAMVNLIGGLPDPSVLLAVEGAHLHRYAKAPRPGRKVGHITVTAPDAEALETRVTALTTVLGTLKGS
jgi:5-(carboxyamino)imidazole ribonucleotide synthase